MSGMGLDKGLTGLAVSATAKPSLPGRNYAALAWEAGMEVALAVALVQGYCRQADKLAWSLREVGETQ
jgi:hypothetical protein